MSGYIKFLFADSKSRHLAALCYVPDSISRWELRMRLLPTLTVPVYNLVAWRYAHKRLNS